MNTKLDVLIVEDEAIIAQDISRIVARIGHRVVGQASSGEEAILLAQALQPSLILMDIHLEGEMDGTEAAAAIHRAQDVPIIFLTAHSDERTLERAKKSSPFGYVVKPIMDRDLRIGIEMGIYRHQAERLLAEHDQWMSAVITGTGEGLIVTDDHGVIKSFNPAACEVTGCCEAEAVQQPLESVLRLLDGNGTALHQDPLFEILQTPVHRQWGKEVFIRRRDGTLIPVDYTASAVRNNSGRLIGMVIVLRDNSERHRAEQERERLVRELQTALANVKTLSGLLPICGFCKSIRNDAGYWQSLERYMESHAEVQFTHGLCPTCLEKNYPELAPAILAKMRQREAAPPSDESPR